MFNPFYVAKKDGVTEQGSWYSILQDEHNGFHVSVTVDEITIHDYFINIPSLEFLDEQIKIMESSATDNFNNT
jgi:hypothetical protein